MLKHYPLAKALLLTLTLFQTFNFTSSTSNVTGFSLNIIPRDSPESPIYFGNLTWDQKVDTMLEITHARAHYLRLTASESLLDDDNDGVPQPQQGGQTPLFITRGFYVTEFMIGTPTKKVFLLMDTGGSLVWTQCLPCIDCYQQSYPLYNSSASSTFKKLPCTHYLCNGEVESSFRCVNDECPYSKLYHSGLAVLGPTKGVAAVETVNFTMTNGVVQPITGFVFGCSNYSVNFSWFQGTPISGIMGLSFASESLASQFSSLSNKRFSYCFMSYTMIPTSPSKLTFGDAIPAPQGTVRSATLLKSPNPRVHLFFLATLDISVGSTKLGFPPGTFDFNDQGTRGLVIDSGALFSSLNKQDLPNGRNVYNEVIESFQSYYIGLGLVRLDVHPRFGLCYRKPRADFKDYLTMTYHFDKGDYVVNKKFMHYFPKNGDFFCVNLLSGNGLSILGSWHQQNVRITYDGNVPEMQFSREICR